MTTTKIHSRIAAASSSGRYFLVSACLLLGLAVAPLEAATLVLYTNDFESYTTFATNWADAVDADPTGSEWNVNDDTALDPTTTGAGVQVINWLAHSGTQSLLLRSATEAQIYLPNAKSGTNYVLDFWVQAVRGAGDRNWYVTLRAMGADSNGDDFLAYRTDRAASSNIFYYDGVGPEAGAWVDTTADHVDNQWQHHRLVMNPNTRKCDIYVDDMVTPVVTGADLARPDSSVPSLISLRHEGNSIDDGYCAIDDISFSVDGQLLDLNTTFTEGFENYPARVADTDDADPSGPWITVESDGNGGGKPLAPGKVQVVDSSVVTPHSGSKCLKLEAGQRAGSSIAWGLTPQADVQVTWWARVPQSVDGDIATYLRMSLYGVEGASSYGGDSALLGYGSRDATVGDDTSLTFYTTKWLDTTVDYTPDTWEEYQLTTHNAQGSYTIIKNPSSANPQIVVDRAGMIGTASSWGPSFMAAWSSSNGTNHPPVYIDDITVKSLVSNANPLPDPYTVTNHTSRFTNVTIVKIPGPVGKAVVDPRDNSTILFAVDATDGGIYRATKVASGNWVVDPSPIVSGLDRPAGLAVDGAGTLWWTHDYTMSLRRLKYPWTNNTVEEIISNFGSLDADDDPIDVALARLDGTNVLVVADRGIDGDAPQGLYLVDPATTTLGQTNYENYLVFPTTAGLGGANLNGVVGLPQSGEVATISEDGFVGVTDASGITRQIIPATLWQDIFTGGPAPSAAAIAVDPTTGFLWIADDVRDQVWAVDPAVGTQSAAPDQLEASFPLTDPNRPDLQIDIHDPGMSFATNGAFMVLSDTSTGNGGGRLIIFHNEAIVLPNISITSGIRNGGNFILTWQSAGSASYDVLRGTDLGNVAGFQTVATNLSATTFTDTNAPAGAAFYRVLAKPN